MKPLTLAIVIPVYNEEDHIVACLDSIASQTERPDEVIVVDNNSTDNTAALASQYGFVTIIKERKQGIAPARSRGYNSARSDLIGRIDADTVLPADWVASAKKYLAVHPNDLLTGGCYLYDLGFSRLTGLITEFFSFRVNKLIIGSYIAWGSNSVFWRRHWLEIKHLMIESDDIHEDIDFGMHFVKQGYQIFYDRKRVVGIDSKIFSPQRGTRKAHFRYLKRWPNTLKRHNLRRAWLGTVGMYVVYSLYYPLIVLNQVSKMYQKSQSILSFRRGW